MSRDILLNADAKMRKAIEVLKKELASIRTGRATPALVDNLRVEYYGIPTPLSQLANISIPEARLIVIQPWDRSALTTIEKAILKSDLGLTPMNDGNVLRLQIPLLTEERRRELSRVVHKRVEEGKVALRNIRRDALEELKGLEKSKEISQDEFKRAQEQMQRLTDSFIRQMEQIGQDKEAEVLEV